MRAAKIEQEIINRLYPGSWLLGDLVAGVSAALVVSVQGVYKAVRKLRAEEVVTVHGKQIALTGVWITKERNRLAFAEQAYKSAAEFAELLQGKKRRITNSFKTLAEVDLYWTHAYFQLAEQVAVSEPTYSVQPHDWYLYVRSETDRFWVQKHAGAGRLSRTLLTHAGPLDRMVMRLRKKELGKLFEFTLNENPLKQSVSTYYSLLGPYIFTAELDPTVASKLDDFIAGHDKLPLKEVAQKEIADIIQAKGKFKFTIDRNEAKAKLMIAKTRKYFEF